MFLTQSDDLHEQLEQHVRSRTGRRVRNLSIALRDERIIISGQATSFYVKQLAQHGVWEILPEVQLENSIVVGELLELTAA